MGLGGVAGLILISLRPTNERRRYNVKPSLIGWAQAYNLPWGSSSGGSKVGCSGDSGGWGGGGGGVFSVSLPCHYIFVLMVMISYNRNTLYGAR